MAEALKTFSLAGRIALVTGGTGHLGTAICRGLAEAGARVMVNGKNPAKVDLLVKALVAAGHEADALPFDVTDGASVIKQMEHLDRLDILVNNASVSRTGTIATISPAEFGASAAINVQAVYALVQAGLPAMRRASGCSIVNVASMYGMVSPDPRIYGDSGYNNPPSYGAAKAGLLQLTRYLACHLAPEHIRVNAVSPGAFPPGDTLRAEQPQFFEALEQKVPMGRIGQPAELASVVVFLASDAASYITGANVPVDGGWTAW